MSDIIIDKDRFLKSIFRQDQVNNCYSYYKGKALHKNIVEMEKMDKERSERIFIKLLGLESAIPKCHVETLDLFRSGKSVIASPKFRFKNALYGTIFKTDATLFLRSKANPNKFDILQLVRDTDIKKIHNNDVVFTKVLAELSGIEIDRLMIVTFNPDYIYDGNKYVSEDMYVSHTIDQASSNFIKRLSKVKVYIQGDGVTLTEGSHCLDCKNYKDCKGKELPEYHICNIANASAKLDKLYRNGQIDLLNDDIDKSSLNANQLKNYYLIKKGLQIYDKASIDDFFSNVTYPEIDFDFETISYSTPRFAGTRPLEDVPYQFTMQIRQENGDLIEHDIIYQGNNDPSVYIMEKIKELLPKKGSVFVWYEDFEKRVNTHLGERFNEVKFFEGFNNRIMDCMKLVSNRYFYQREFRGGNSLKVVTNTLFPELNYENEEISDGYIASKTYQKMYESGEFDQEVVNAQLKYCNQDGLVMRMIRDHVKNMG